MFSVSFHPTHCGRLGQTWANVCTHPANDVHCKVLSRSSKCSKSAAWIESSCLFCCCRASERGASCRTRWLQYHVVDSFFSKTERTRHRPQCYPNLVAIWFQALPIKGIWWGYACVFVLGTSRRILFQVWRLGISASLCAIVPPCLLHDLSWLC